MSLSSMLQQFASFRVGPIVIDTIVDCKMINTLTKQPPQTSLRLNLIKAKHTRFKLNDHSNIDEILMAFEP